MIVSVAGVAHNPAVGVNVYKVVTVLFNAGDQVPVIPLIEVVGKGLIIVPAQTGATALKTGKVAAPKTGTLMLTVSVQPRASFTVIVYCPLLSAKKILLD